MDGVFEKRTRSEMCIRDRISSARMDTKGTFDRMA